MNFNIIDAATLVEKMVTNVAMQSLMMFHFQAEDFLDILRILGS